MSGEDLFPSGEDAMTELRDGEFDILPADLVMPGMGILASVATAIGNARPNPYTIDNLPDMVHLKDAGSRFLLANTAQLRQIEQVIVHLAVNARDAVPGSLGQSSPRTLTGTETVLVVEDEEMIRSIADLTLSEAGYAVLQAKDAEDAVVAAGKHAGEIHLLLCDVVLLKGNGRETALRLSALRPRMRVLFMSGYTENTIVHRGILDSGIAFLPKPFAALDLLRKVREVLDGP